MVEHETTVEGLVRLYVQQAPVVDRQHLQLRYAAMEQVLPTVGKVADRAYASYTNSLNQRFSALYTAQDTADIPGLPLVTAHLEQHLWYGAGRRAVVIVDALRYDCAHALRNLRIGQHVEVQAMRAALPTATPIGMTALLPLGSAVITLEVEHNTLHPKVNEKDTAVRADRLAFLSDFGADCRDIEDLENMATRPPDLGNLLVVFGHEEVDHLGHGSADTLIRNIDNFIVGRKRFSRDQWLDLMLRSMGYEPSHPSYTNRQKFHHMMRLVPFVEKNLNLVELGPRGTGKSFVYQQMSPYGHLVSGGQTTTAQMFGNLSSGQRGLVCLWDVVAFDGAAGIRFPDRNGINIMKGYMEDGAFSRGRDIITAEGSVVFVGNLDGAVETIIRTPHLFYPMPKEMDTAFYDRIHAYIPGWEFQKTRDELYSNHFGLVTDYLAEVFREFRKSG